MIIPHTEETDWRAIDEKTLKTNYTKTYLFLENFKEKLRNRPKYIKRRAGHPYYILLDIRKNTFSKVKVIIRRMGNKLIAAVSEDIVIPFETTTYISLNNLEEAYYLCGILNTSVVEKYVESYSPKGRSFGSPHIFKNVRIPKFDSNNIIHKNISRLSNKAHLIKSGNYDANVQEIEKKINNLVKKLFKSI